MITQGGFYKSYVFPNGALTSKSYVFGSRPWELKNYEIFDPTAEFYQPISIDIVNNVIQRILPVNSYAGAGYNWISNRLRFLFESISEPINFEFNMDSPVVSVLSIWFDTFRGTYTSKVRLVRRGWYTSVTNLVIRFFNLAQISKGGVFFSHRYNLDLFSAFEFSKLIFKAPYLFKVPDLGGFSSCDNFSRLFSLKFVDPGALVSQLYSKILLISFNPYFSDPAFNYYLRKCVCNKASMVYTLFSSYSITNLTYKNTVCTSDTLVQMFSGCHNWSRVLGDSVTLIVIDPVFIQSLPSSVSSIILKFITNCPERVYIPNATKYSFSPMGFSSSNSKIGAGFQFCSKNNLRIYHSFFLDCDSAINWDKVPEFQNVNISSLTSADNYCLFNFDLVTLSQFHKPIFGTRGFMRYMFPVSPFVGFSTAYKFHSSLIAHRLRRSISVVNRKPIGTIFKIISRRFTESRQQSHYVFPEFLFLISILLQLFHRSLFVTFFVSAAFNSESWITHLIGPYRVLSKWYISSKFYFANINVCDLTTQRYGSVISVTTYNRKFSVCYFDFGIFFLGDAYIISSKTLMLERAFFLARFNNFAI